MSALAPAALGAQAGKFSGSVAWLLSHAHVAASPVGVPPAPMSLAQTWTPARGHADPVDRAQVEFLDSVEIEVPVSRGGLPLTARQAAKVNRRLERLRELVRQAWRGPQDDGRLVIVNNQVMRLQTLLDRFYWRPAGASAYLGTPCLRFAFAPRPSAPAANRAEQVMGAMAGDACVAAESGLVLEVHFHNQEPVKFGWGLLGDFHAISGAFTLRRTGTSWVWGRIIVHLHGRELWFNKSGTMVKFYRLGSPGAPPPRRK